MYMFRFYLLALKGVLCLGIDGLHGCFDGVARS